MGAVPNKKVTKSRQRSRFVAYKLQAVNYAHCSRCRSPKRPHTACPQCGYYRGRQIVGAEN